MWEGQNNLIIFLYSIDTKLYCIPYKHSYVFHLAGKGEVCTPFDCKLTKLYKPSSKFKVYGVCLTIIKKFYPIMLFNYFISYSVDIYKMELNQTSKQFQVVCHEDN